MDFVEDGSIVMLTLYPVRIRLSWLLTSLDEVECPSSETWANHRDVLAWHLQDGQVNTLLPR